MTYLGIALGFIAGNFAYQALTEQYLWAVAAERSFFEALAFLFAWLVLNGRGNGEP